MGDSFQIFRPSSIRDSSRRVCSSSVTSSQYLRRWTPDSTMIFSNAGTISRKALAWASVQNPITRSTPARLYQLRSKITTSPAAGRYGMYRWEYIWDFSRSVGAGRATTRNTRGLTRSVMALITPPLPAPSRPSNTMQIFIPLSFTHSCRLTSSSCSSSRCFSYTLRLSLSFDFFLPMSWLLRGLWGWKHHVRGRADAIHPDDPRSRGFGGNVPRYTSGDTDGARGGHAVEAEGRTGAKGPGDWSSLPTLWQ